ncbi:unnamed protein product [Rotaria sp. Silwood2]|nr:unnamed protein product [Rotaria sp. Silwood2]CAF4399715.1 unnamed protein product [Rotaria sp. Silwood2]
MIKTDVLKYTDLNGALKDHEEALSIFEQSIPVGHQVVANCLTAMGSLYFINDRSDSALQCHLKALDLYRRTLSSDHINIADSFRNIRLKYWYMKNLTEALRFLNESLSIYRASCGPESEEMKLVEADIAKLNAEQKTVARIESVQDNFNEEQRSTTTLHFDTSSSFA